MKRFKHPIEYKVDGCKEDEYFRPVTTDSVSEVKPQYFISNYGNFYSLYSDSMMKPTIAYSKRRSGGYYVNTVQTQHGPETVLNHRVEMIEFNYQPGCEELIIDHINTNKRDNYIDNLEWVTIAENTRRASKNGLLLTGEDAPWTTLSDNQVHQICQLYEMHKYSQSQIAKIVGCKPNRVFDIIHGITRTNITSQYKLPYNSSSSTTSG